MIALGNKGVKYHEQELHRMVFVAILSGILGLLIGLFGVGLSAAKVLEAIHGTREGAAAMAGFFYFGPIGGIAGTLIGVGLALRFGGGSATWGKGLMIAAAVITILGGVLFAITALPDARPSYSHVIEFELEVPAAVLTSVDIPGPHAMWGAAGADMDDKPFSQFFDKRCEGSVCVLTGSVAAVGPLYNFRIAVLLGPKAYRFPLSLPATVTGPIDWSAWHTSDDARLRWRIVKR
jgi:hypothetical protein